MSSGTKRSPAASIGDDEGPEFEEARYKPSFGEIDNEVGSETSISSERSDGSVGGRLKLSKEPGTGAVGSNEVLSDQQTHSEFESPARTYFDEDELEVDSEWEERKWRRLKRWQRGTKPNYDGYGMDDRQSMSQRYHQTDKKRFAATFCSTCDMNSAENDVVVGYSDELDYVAFGAHSNIWKGLLGLIAVVAESRRSTYSFCHTDMTSEEIEETLKQATLEGQTEFKELMETVGLDKDGLDTVKRIIYSQRPGLKDL